MTKQTKTTLIVLGIGIVAYYLYTKGKLPLISKPKPMGATTSFSGNEDFFNLSSDYENSMETEIKTPLF